MTFLSYIYSLTVESVDPRTKYVAKVLFSKKSMMKIEAALIEPLRKRTSNRFSVKVTDRNERIVTFSYRASKITRQNYVIIRLVSSTQLLNCSKIHTLGEQAVVISNECKQANSCE